MPKTVICRDINGIESEVSVDKLILRPSVYGVLIEDGRVLLSRQWSGYDFPGGGIEADEDIETALKREVFEETGLKVEPIMPLLCATDYFNPDYSEKYKGQFWKSLLMYYLVKKVGGELSKDNLCDTELAYADMPEWVALTDIDKHKYYNPIDSPVLIRRACEISKSFDSKLPA